MYMHLRLCFVFVKRKKGRNEGREERVEGGWEGRKK
jgi:hypothetical protein